MIFLTRKAFVNVGSILFGIVVFVTFLPLTSAENKVETKKKEAQTETKIDIAINTEKSSKVELLNEVINTHHVEYTPFITPDEKYLIFESNRPGSIGEYGDFDLWIAENKAEAGQKPKFSYPVNFGDPINSVNFDGLPTLRVNEQGNLELYFTSLSSSNRKGPDQTNIYYSVRKDGKWSIPVAVEIINTNFNDRMPSLSQDGNRLYFSSDRPGGLGKDDIWVSTYNREKSQWTEPVNLGPQINGDGSEISPSIHNDTVTLYFSSDRAGGFGNYDIYVTQHNNESGRHLWSKPKNLGEPYNSKEDDEYPTVTQNGKYMYFSSNRPGGFGGFDIYRAEIPDFARPKVVVKITGRVHEETSLKGIEANLRIDGPEGFRNITTQLHTGKYEMELINDQVYKITISAPGFHTKVEEINLKNLFSINQILNINYPLSRIFYIPNTLKINLVFKDDKNNILTPALQLNEAAMKGEELQLSMQQLFLQVPKTIENKLDYEAWLKKKKIAIVADLKDFPKTTVSLEMSQVFKEPYQEKEATVEFILTRQLVAIDNKKEQKETKDQKEDQPVKGTRRLATILFPLNEAIYYKGQQKNVDLLIAALKKEKFSVVEIHGHTDASGTQKENFELSKRRAEYLKKILEEQGIKTDMIKTFWHANQQPVVRDKKKKVIQANRRVEIFVKK